MKPKCPYCDRPLRMFGMRCRACRRYVFSWFHILAFAVLGVVAFGLLVELLVKVL